MDLDSDLPISCDVRFGLDIIQGGHAVDPAADAVPFGEDTVFVPLAFLDRGEDRGGVLGFSDDLIATALVVELAIPALTIVDLVTTHLGAVRYAYATHLDPAVDEARASQAKFDAQIEILVRLLRREEEVLRHLLLEGAAADLTVLDAPPGGIAFPSGQGLPIEQGNRGGLNGQSEEQGQEATHGKVGLIKS